MILHRLTDHGKETLCGHAVILQLDRTGKLQSVHFAKSQKPVKIITIGRNTSSDHECNTCHHIWRRSNLGGIVR